MKHPLENLLLREVFSTSQIKIQRSFMSTFEDSYYAHTAPQTLHAMDKLVLGSPSSRSLSVPRIPPEPEQKQESSNCECSQRICKSSSTESICNHAFSPPMQLCVSGVKSFPTRYLLIGLN